MMYFAEEDNCSKTDLNSVIALLEQVDGDR